MSNWDSSSCLNDISGECAMCPVLMKDLILSDDQILQSYGFPPHTVLYTILPTLHSKEEQSGGIS